MRSGVPAVSALLVIQFFVAVTIAADTYPESKTADGPEKGVVLSEFIYVDAPFPECHATTIAESKHGIVAAWFGGQHEKNPDVGIWVAHRTAAGWSKPVEVVNGIQHSRRRYPCWNPVISRTPFTMYGGLSVRLRSVAVLAGRWLGVERCCTRSSKLAGVSSSSPAS